MTNKVIQFPTLKTAGTSSHSVHTSDKDWGLTAPSFMASKEEIRTLNIMAKVVKQSEEFNKYNYDNELGQFLEVA